MASSGCRIRADRLALAALLLAASGCTTQDPMMDAAGREAPATSAADPAIADPRAQSIAGDAEGPAVGVLGGAPPGRAAPATDPGVVLPAGAGREVLTGACLSCHDLGGLELFKGFYTRDSWRDLVLTMQAHGAPVNAAEVEVLADYLAMHFGPRPQNPSAAGGE